MSSSIRLLNQRCLNFRGAVNSNTCDVAIGGSASPATVTLTTALASDLSAPASNAKHTPFTVALSNCSVPNGTATLFFEPNSYSLPNPRGNLNIANLTDGSPVAQNVELQLLGNQAGVLTKIDLHGGTPADQGVPTVVLTGGAGNLDFFVRYYSDAGGAVAGKADSTISFTLDVI